MNTGVTKQEHPLGAVVLHWAHLGTFVVLTVTGFQIHALGSGTAGTQAHSLHAVAMLAFIASTVMRYLWAFLSDGSAVRGGTELVADWQHFIMRRGDGALALKWVAHYLRPGSGEPHVIKYNPLQRFVYVACFPLGILAMAVTGFALSPQWSDYFGWVSTGLGGEAAVRSLHYVLMWVMIVLTMMHMYAAIIDGWRRIALMLLWVAPSPAVAPSGASAHGASSEPHLEPSVEIVPETGE